MNNVNHPGHNNQPERSAPYDYNGPFDEFDRRVNSTKRTTRDPRLANTMARARASYRRRQQALPAVAIGLTALIAVGGFLAITGSQSGAARANPNGGSGDVSLVDEVSNLTEDESTSALVVTLPGEVVEQSTIPTTIDDSPIDVPLLPPVPRQATPPVPVPPPTPDPVAPTPGPTTDQTDDISDDETPVDETPVVETPVVETPADVRTGSDQQVLFWNRTFIGHWENGQFVAATWGSGPDWLIDTEIELRNASGAIMTGTVASCNDALVFTGDDPYSASIDYWYTDGAPLNVSRTNTDDGEQQMISLLAEGISVDQIDSYGAAIAADGSADRLVWGRDDYGTVNWIATYDIETNQFRTVLGEAGAEPTDAEIGRPNGVWTDLDNDGNLESIYTSGDVWSLKEWATDSEIWVGSPDTCGT